MGFSSELAKPPDSCPLYLSRASIWEMRGRQAAPGSERSTKRQPWALETAGSSPVRCAAVNFKQKGGEQHMEKVDQEAIGSIYEALSLASRHLAEAAASLAASAVPAVGLPLAG